VPLTITENGNIPVPKPGKIDIEIDARPQGAVDDSQDVRVGGVSGFSVAGLAPGHAKSTTVSASLPAGLPTDSYKLVAKIDAAGAVDDDTSNNTIVTPAAIDVTKGYVDLIGSFGKVSTPPCVVDYTPFSGKVPLIIQNAGNVAIPSGQKVNIAVVAHDTATGDDIPLTALTNQSISGLAADGIKTLLAKINKLPGGLDEGDYEIQATISPMGNLTEENPDNNVVTADALGSLVTLSVAPKFIDLAVGAPYLGFTGNIFMPNDNPKVKPKVSFTLCNIGNTNASGDVKFYLWAHNEVTRVNTLLARSTQTVSISWNGSKSLSFDYTIPSYLPAGQYTFSVELENTSTQLGKQDTNSNNNIGYNLTTYFRGGDIRSFASFSQQGDGTYELSVLTYEADVTNFGDPAGSYWVVPIHVTAVPANHQVTFSIDLPSDFYDVGLGQLIMVFPNNIPKKNTVSLSARARSVAFPIGRLYGPSSQWIAKTTTTITQLEYNVEGVDITLNVGDLGKRIASTDLDFEILILDGQFAGQNDGTSIATTWGTRFKGVAVGGSIGYAFA
jgi:hypothetical protein